VNETVWVSTLMVTMVHVLPMRNDKIAVPDEGISGEPSTILKRNDQGESLDQSFFPKKVWATQRFDVRRKLPYVFHGYGYYVISAACADVFRQFDMGQGHLYPVSVVGKDRMTPLDDGEWFCINFGNQKQAVILENSLGAKENPFQKGIWQLSFEVQDNQIFVSGAALHGPDIWIDTGLLDGLFMSNRLVAALKRAKLDRRFGFRRCVIA
jgi:hypothetical protein